MLPKSQNTSILYQKSQQNYQPIVVKKTIHFNEKNVGGGHHTVQKDYGFMNIPEARYADHVLAEYLRNRLRVVLDRTNRTIKYDNENDDYGLLGSFNVNKLQIPLVSKDCHADKQRRAEFYRKRKKFNQSEFIIAKQKLMSNEISEPGPSIGENWHIVNNAVDNAPSNLTLFTSHIRISYESSVNYETLNEIKNQISLSHEQCNRS